MFSVLSLVTGALLYGSDAWGAPLDPADYASLGALLDPNGPVHVDTDGPILEADGVEYEGVMDRGVAIFTFDEIALHAPLNAEGSVPFALLSRGDMVIDARIALYARGAEPGPGGYPGGTRPDGEDGEGPGGGESTPGGGGGGFGGAGGDSEGGGDGGAAYGDLAIQLEGGSGGGKCRDTLVIENGDGGGGGGALELGALGRLDVTASGIISADGGDGESSSQVHGGGGGSGGAIALHGRGGRCDGVLSAHGGAGGDDNGAFFNEGGGGGGGRIAMLDLENECETDVTGGSSPNFGSGDPGVVTFREWIDPGTLTEEPTGTTTPGGTTPQGTGDPGDPTDPGPGTGGEPTDPVPDEGDPFAGESLAIKGGCGCDSPGSPVGGLGAALGAAALLARRRRSLGR